MKFSTNLKRQIVDLILNEIAEQQEMEAPESILGWENGLREALNDLGADCVEGLLEYKAARYPSPTVNCACGKQAHYHSKRRAKTLTVFGWVNYRRAYYLCSNCHSGHHPLDQRLGLRPGQVSVALASLLALEGIETSFEQARRKVARMLLVDVSENTLRKATQMFGALQATEERQWITESQDEEFLFARRRSITDPPARLYGALDGVQVPIEAEYRELKCGCWYEVTCKKKNDAAAVGETGFLRATRIGYYCDLTDATTFRDLVWATGCQRAADRAQEVVFVADGAAWIWNIVQYHFPQAVQIVDWYHAAEYLNAVAQVAFDAEDVQRQKWLEQARTQLWEGAIEQVIALCRQHEQNAAAAPWVHKAVTYFTNNRERMDYKRLREQGYQIGSGNVESACKQIATQRLKRAGARWAEPGACHTAKARAAWLSDTWDALVTRADQLARAA